MNFLSMQLHLNTGKLKHAQYNRALCQIEKPFLQYWSRPHDEWRS